MESPYLFPWMVRDERSAEVAPAAAGPMAAPPPNPAADSVHSGMHDAAPRRRGLCCPSQGLQRTNAAGAGAVCHLLDGRRRCRGAEMAEGQTCPVFGA